VRVKNVVVFYFGQYNRYLLFEFFSITDVNKYGVTVVLNLIIGRVYLLPQPQPLSDRHTM